MSVVVKGGLIAAVLAVGCTGTYFLMSGERSMPEYTTVSGASGTSAYDGKVGAGYKHILVDTNKNEDWWKWSYDRWLSESKKENGQLSDEFKNKEKVSSAFSAETNSTTALNKVCAAAYNKSDTSEVDFSKPTASEEAKHKLGKDILKYCSPLGERPETIEDHQSETYTGSNHIGNTNKATLASAQSPKNRHFWSAMQKYLMTSKPTDAFFQRISAEKTIQTLCRESYGKAEATESAATANNPKTTEVTKYCAFAKLTT